jgi:hypothetical protein
MAIENTLDKVVLPLTRKVHAKPVLGPGDTALHVPRPELLALPVSQLTEAILQDGVRPLKVVEGVHGPAVDLPGPPPRRVALPAPNGTDGIFFLHFPDEASVAGFPDWIRQECFPIWGARRERPKAEPYSGAWAGALFGEDLYRLIERSASAIPHDSAQALVERMVLADGIERTTNGIKLRVSSSEHQSFFVGGIRAQLKIAGFSEQEVIPNRAYAFSGSPNKNRALIDLLSSAIGQIRSIDFYEYSLERLWRGAAQLQCTMEVMNGQVVLSLRGN